MPTPPGATVTVDPETQPARPQRLAARQQVELPGEVKRTAPAKPAAPAPAAVAPPRPSAVVADIDQYEETDLGPVRSALPVFDAVVVYLGNNRKKSVSLRGHMHVSSRLENEDGTMTEIMVPVPGEGIQCYDFTSHGTDGRAIRSRLLPADSRDPALANKPHMIVNHPDHLLTFFKARESENGPLAFKVLVAKHQRLAWQDFVLKNNRFDPQTGADVLLVDSVLKDV